MKKPILILLALSILSIATIALLTLNSTRQLYTKNGFERHFEPSYNIRLIKDYTLEKPVFSIAGIDKNRVYLGTASPGEIIKLNLNEGETETEQIHIDEVKKFEGAFHTAVFYPDIFITGTNARKIIRGNLQKGWKEAFHIAAGPVLSSQFIDRENAIIRFIDTSNLQPYLAKFNLLNGLLGDPIPITHIKDSNNIFSHNGMLHYDSISARAVYVNFHSNQIIAFDKHTLDVQRMQTIDTVFHPKVKTLNTGEDLTTRQSPVIVNRKSCYYKGIIYVNSALLSDNENVKDFSEKTVIDVYDKVYKNSFYIPVYPNEIRDIKMLSENEIIVLTKNKIKLFHLF